MSFPLVLPLHWSKRPLPTAGGPGRRTCIFLPYQPNAQARRAGGPAYEAGREVGETGPHWQPHRPTPWIYHVCGERMRSDQRKPGLEQICREHILYCRLLLIYRYHARLICAASATHSLMEALRAIQRTGAQWERRRWAAESCLPVTHQGNIDTASAPTALRPV
jgi:hypothetical protein